MHHFGSMRKIVSAPLALLALVSSSRVWAGPTTAAMTSADAPAISPALPAPVASTTFDSLTPPAGIREANLTSADELFADEHEVAPNDPHPMIPLPPSACAGFIGLAFVARHVLRRHAATSVCR